MQEQQQFKPGDAVQLKQGGPVMHVVTTSQNLCYCNWCDEQGTLQHGTFSNGSLQPVAPEQLS